MGGRGRAVMPGDKHCRICLQTVTAKRYRTLYHEDIVPLHRHIRSVVGPIRKDDVDGMSNFEFLCNLCCTKVKQLEVAHIKIRKIQRFIESNLDALTAIHESARQKLFTVKIAPTQTSETMNSIGHEDMLQPGKQYTIMYLSKRIKLESDMPDDSDSNSCTARRWVVAENGMLTEVSTLDTNISTKNSTLPINKERGDEDVIRSEVNETNRTEEVGTEQKGSTDIVPTERWRGMITNEVNKTYGTEEICTVGEGMTDTVFVEECHDVVVKTEVIQSDRTEDVGTVQERSTNIVPTEECCDVVNKSEVIQCDRTEHIGTIGTMQERTTNIVPTEECCDVVNKSEVVQCDRTEHIGTMQERTTNIVPTEECCDVVNKSEVVRSDRTECVGTVQERTTNIVPTEDCYDVVKVTETLKATDKTQSTASLLATSADIPVKLRSTRRPSVLKCSVCSKMFGRVRCLKVHERLHMQLKSYSRRSMIVERENVDV